MRFGVQKNEFIFYLTKDALLYKILDLSLLTLQGLGGGGGGWGPLLHNL